MRKVLLPALAVALLGPACFSQASSVSVPKDTGTKCRSHCKRLGMELGAVVIIMNSAGCVCEPRREGKTPKAAGATAAGAAAVQAALLRRKRSGELAPDNRRRR